MIEAIRNALKIPDLRRRILFTLLILAIYRFGSYIPVPGVKVGLIQKALSQQGGAFDFLDLFTGGALARFAVFALGIMPYITASIIMQLLTVVVPTFERWQKEGEIGQRKITQVTRYMTLGIAIVESVGYTILFQSLLKINFTPLQRYLIVVTLTAGTALIMWLGELITQRGIGNGMSLLIFTSIISRMPESVTRTFQVLSERPVILAVFFIILAAIIISIIVVEKGQRRIPIQYAKRVVGRRIYGGTSTYIPLKINSAGVIPIIFATSLLILPTTLSGLFPNSAFFTALRNGLTSSGSALRIIVLAALIIGFTYFYTAIVFNPIDIADNVKKYGGFVPGVRPGRPTAVHLNKVLNRITLPGSFFLATIALFPEIIGDQLNIPFWQPQNFGGTSMLIMVGVALETMTQLESHLLQRHYEGFLK